MGQLSFCPSVVIAQIYHTEIGKKNEKDFDPDGGVSDMLNHFNHPIFRTAIVRDLIELYAHLK